MKNDYLVKYSLHPGDYENLSLYEQRRYITFHFFSTVAIIISFIRLLYINFFSTIDYEPVVKFINTIPFAVCVIASFFTNSRNYKKVLAGFYLVIPVLLSVTQYYTADEGIQNFILICVILSFFFFDKPIELIIAFLYNSLHYIIISNRSFFYLSNKMQVIPYDTSLAIFNNITSMVLLFFAFYISKVQLWKYEKTIIDRSLELENQNNLKDKVFSTIAHDLKSPMAANLTLLKALENNTDLSREDYNGHLSAIRASVEDTNRLVFDMLTWAKNELQKAEPLMERIAVKEIVAEIIKELEFKAVEKRINLVYEESEIDYVTGDRNAMKIILRNLVSNAIKFTASGGYVKIISSHTAENFCITVEDNGIGINPEKLENLLTGTFYTTKGTNNETGTGLGLIICDSLAKKIKGSLKIDSKINLGTTARLSLPCYI